MNPNPLTTPLLYLVALNTLPSLWLRPYGMTLVAGVLIGYRVLLERGARPMPPWWLRVPAQVAAFAGVWAEYRTLLGDESAGTLLLFLTALKTFELRTPRDHFVGYLLCLLVLMSHLLLDQSLPMTLFLIADGVLLTSYLFVLGQGRLDLAGISLGPSVVAALKAAPLVVAIFILFPRFNTGFGSGEDSTGQMGVTDQLHPGSISSLVGSNELVFRARYLDQPVPARATLYWRSAVLDQSDGLNWERGKLERRSPDARATGPAAIEVTLEPGFDRFIHATADAPQPVFINEDVRRAVIARGAGTFELGTVLRTRQRYWLHERRGTDFGEEPGRYLAVKRAPSRRMAQFIQEHRGADAASTVHALLGIFRKDYAYTLEPPHVRGLDDFVFGTRAGFCEHFAGALATMLRYAQVPARVVVGFQGGSPSLLDHFVTVRANDAHAWVEWFDATKNKWRRVDPTSQLDPRRIDEGSGAYLAAASSGWASTFNFAKARAAFDEIDAAWTGFLIRFDRAEQRRIAAKFGLDGQLAWLLPLTLILVVAVLAAGLYAFETRRRRPQSPIERIYREALRRAEKAAKLRRGPAETAVAFARRAPASHLTEALAVIEPLLFGPGTPGRADLARARSAARAVGRLADARDPSPKR